MAKPIFCIAHPRACSTAFERVFMTRTDDVICFHEPFGDAFYYGPERMGTRYESDEAARLASGFAQSTFKSILDRICSEENKDKRIFVKDISYYTIPPNGQEAQIAPSLAPKRRGIGTVDSSEIVGSSKATAVPFPYGTHTEPGNPTVLPEEILEKFHFTFLIRDPHYSIPSFFRCTVPPIDRVTGWNYFDPAEAGYHEQRALFDFLVAKGHIGPTLAGRDGVSDCLHANGMNGANGTNGVHRVTNGINGDTNGINGHKAAKDGPTEICVVDADSLLDDPEGIIRGYCRSIGLNFSFDMLQWDSEEAHDKARMAFEKWKGWHEDAIDSKDLKPRLVHKKEKTEEEFDAEWTKRFGQEGANIIRATVDANMADYLHLKQFAMKV